MTTNPRFPYEITNVHFDPRGLVLIDYAHEGAFDDEAGGIAFTYQAQVRMDATDDIKERLLELLAAANDVVQFAEERSGGQPRTITGG